MALWHKKKADSPEEKPAKPFIEDYPYEDIDSITADLPGQDEPDEAAADDEASLTPEEAMARFRRQRSEAHEQEPEGRQPRALRSKKRAAADADQPAKTLRFHRKKPRREEPDIEEDDEEAEDLTSFGTRHPRLRTALRLLITIGLAGVMAVMALSNFLGPRFYDLPTRGISGVVTPVQNVFSQVVETVAGYFRGLKLRANLEEAYNEVVAENERLTYVALQAQELQYQLSQFENMSDEIAANQRMEPIICRVIGRSDGNYFSTFTINRGTADGIGQYMAVTISGALVGYTETVKEHESSVRTIIDSEASIAGLIQSSRDQGTVRGTLGVDGTAMCRMYYLPEDHLPRPGDVVVTSGVGMSFPKGIPIGTVRESTRRMESNKQFIVVEPTADFEHIEWVIVLRYQPDPEPVTGVQMGAASVSFVPLETARPYPTLRIGSMNYFGQTATPDPNATGGLATMTPAPTATPSPTPDARQTLIPLQTVAPEPTEESWEYVPIDGSPTATPTAEPTPSPTPFITLGPQDLTLEDDGW